MKYALVLYSLGIYVPYCTSLCWTNHSVDSRAIAWMFPDMMVHIRVLLWMFLFIIFVFIFDTAVLNVRWLCTNENIILCFQFLPMKSWVTGPLGLYFFLCKIDLKWTAELLFCFRNECMQLNFPSFSISSLVILVRKVAVIMHDTDAARSNRSAFIGMTNGNTTGHFR